MTKPVTLYLHIGQHKTGTSTIQSFFWKNRNRIERDGILYPEIGMSGSTHANFALSLPGKRDDMLATMFSGAAHDRSGVYKPYKGEDADTLFAELGEQIERTNCHAVLLSSECFMEWIEPAMLKILLDQYCQCDVKIVLFLRRQDQWIQAVFNQVVKDPGLRYGGRLEELPQIGMLDYRRTVQQWAEAFGKSNIMVRPYQKAKCHEMGVVGILTDLVGLQKINHYEMPSFEERNVSLRRWQLKILHALNRRDASFKTFDSVLKAFSEQNALFGGEEGTTTCMEFSRAKALQRYFRRDNNWIARNFLSKRQLFGKPKRSEYNDSEGIDSDSVADLLSRIHD